MTGGMPAWGWVALGACTIAALLLGMWVGYGRGFGHGTEEADWQREDARWKGLAEEARRPVPVRPPVAPEPQRDGPGKHRHPAGPRHAALPVAGYLTAPEAGLWGGTITMAAPVQQLPPWEAPEPPPTPAPEPEPEPEPPTEVLEPTAADCHPAAPDPCTDSAWTKRMAEDMDRWIAEHIGATDNVLKEITR